ncbi:MAG: D-2-hydroxyacid dehydrogenase [Halieaceae bacterium]
MKALTRLIAALFFVATFSTAAAELPVQLQELGLRESPVAAKDMPGWKKPERILVSTMFGPQLLDVLQAQATDIELVPVANAQEAAAAAPGAQAVIGICDQAVFDKADQLHWVQVFFAGVENCVSLPGVQNGLILTNGQRLSSPTIGDHAIALMYALVRGIDIAHGNQVNQVWARASVEGVRSFGELSGRTMLVVGLGGIGTQVAKRAHALGMRVVATRGSRREGPDYVDYVGLAPEAITLAKEADIVVNAAPLTSATKGMFNEAFFSAMKSSAYFINVGRGESAVTADLIKALNEGQIAGAGLDVTDPEPLPPEHPLWSTPRVLITPHVAALSMETLGRIQALLAENLRRYVAGEPLLSVVDVKRGY